MWVEQLTAHADVEVVYQPHVLRLHSHPLAMKGAQRRHYIE
jgi:hypothetical protein